MKEHPLIFPKQTQNRFLKKLIPRLLKSVNHFLINDQNFQSIEKQQLENYALVLSMHILLSQLRERIESGEKLIFTIRTYIFTETFSSPYSLDYHLIEYVLDVFDKSSLKLAFLNEVFDNLDYFSLLDLVSNCLGLLTEINSNRYEHGVFYTPEFVTSFIIGNVFNLFVCNNYENIINCTNFDKEKSIEENYRNIIRRADQEGILHLLLTTPLIDPAVGTGCFFITALNLIGRLIQDYIKASSPSDKLQVETLFKDFIDFSNNYCYGFDIDIYALLVARIRILLIIIKWLLLFDKDFLIASITNIRLSRNFFLLDTLLLDIPAPQGKYLVVGNPPWGAKINTNLEKIKIKYKVATHQFDTWSIFLERMIEFLSDHSILGVIIPNTLVNNPNYISVRELILKRTQIIAIINLGDAIFDDVTQPVMVLILQKMQSYPGSQTRILNSLTSEQRYLLKNHQLTLWDQEFVYEYVNQLFWENNSTFDFQIFNIGYEGFINRIENKTFPLKEIVNNTRGIEIGKKGKIILCPECQFFNPPFGKMIFQKSCSNCGFLLTSNNLKEEYIITKTIPNYIHQSTPIDTFYDKVFLGEHIHRFYAKHPYYINLNCKGINYKKQIDYLGPKLLLAKTGHNLAFYVDESKTYTLQVVYIFRIKDSYSNSYSYYALAGILNSAVLYTYYYKKYADINRKQFPHFIQTRILEIPIPIFSSSNQELFIKISSLAKTLHMYYQTLNTLKDSYFNLVHQKNDFLKINFFKFLLEYNVLVDPFLGTTDQFLTEKNPSHLYLSLEKDNILVIGYIEMNVFITLIEIKCVSSLMAIIIFLTLSYQRVGLSTSEGSLKDLFEKRIYFLIPKLISSSMLERWYKDTLFHNDFHNIDQYYKLIQSILPSELLLNELVLQLYQLNDPKYKKILLYPVID